MTLETAPKRLNVMDYASKPELLRGVKAERQGFYDLVDQVGESGWEGKTASGEWQGRDLVGHMIDVTEAYIERFGMAARARRPRRRLASSRWPACSTRVRG